MNPQVSVIIPTYNRARYLPAAVDSVLRQTFSDFEVIVVDDGSTDDTGTVMQRYAGDPRVRYFRKGNGGCASARNFGLGHVRGEFIEHLDSDDILVETDLELKVKALLSLPEDVAGVFSDCFRSVREGKVEAKTFYQNFGFLESLSLFIDEQKGDLYTLNRRFYERHLTECLISPNILIRKQVYDLIGTYDETMSAGQDWVWFTRLTRTFRVAYLDLPLMYYRFWIPGNASDSIRLAGNALKMYEKFLREELSPTLRAQILRAIGKARFNRGYLLYKRGSRWKACLDAMAAVRRGSNLGESAGLVLLCLVPEWLARRLKKINPYRGRPVG